MAELIPFIYTLILIPGPDPPKMPGPSGRQVRHLPWSVPGVAAPERQ